MRDEACELMVGDGVILDCWCQSDDGVIEAVECPRCPELMWARVDGCVVNRVLTWDRANLKDDGAEDIEEVMQVAGVVAGCLDGMQCVGDEGADAV